MKKKILSVVVTAHNLQNHIMQSMESVFHSLADKISLCEIIMIDDASTDQTSGLLQDVASKNSHCFYYRTEFKNIGKVRNFAVSRCNGKYITMVDGDDLLYSNALAELISFIEQNEFDILVTPLQEVRGMPPALSGWKWQSPKKLESDAAIREFLVHKKFQGHFIGKIIKKTLLEAYPFPEFTCYEDIALLPTLLSKSEQTLYNEVPFYLYIKYAHSLSNKLTSAKVNLRAQALTMMDAELGEKWRYLTAPHIIQLLYKHNDQLSDSNRNSMNNILYKTPLFKFFISPLIKLSIKKKYIILKCK